MPLNVLLGDVMYTLPVTCKVCGHVSRGAEDLRHHIEAGAYIHEITALRAKRGELLAACAAARDELALIHDEAAGAEGVHIGAIADLLDRLDAAIAKN